MLKGLEHFLKYFGLTPDARMSFILLNSDKKNNYLCNGVYVYDTNGEILSRWLISDLLLDTSKEKLFNIEVHSEVHIIYV